MTPDGIMQSLRQLVMAVVAFAMSLGGAVGGLPARGQAKAIMREAFSVPQLPADDLLAVDEVDGLEDDLDEETEDEDADDDQEEDDLDEEDQEEIDPDELDDPVEVRFIVLRGPITERPADGVIGTWVIAGREVQVTEATVVSTRAARSSAGDWAQVKAEMQLPDEEEGEEGDEVEGEEEEGEEVSSARLVASSLSVMSSTNNGRVVGIIESIGDKDEAGKSIWRVSGVDVTVAGSTHIVGTPQVGRLADVHGAMSVEEPASEEVEDQVAEDDESEAPAVAFVAKLVVVRGTPNLPKEERQREKEKKHSTVRVEGVIESMADGAWIISGQTVQVSGATRIDEKKGAAEVGASVRVLAELDEEGNLVALEITVQKAKGNPKGNDWTPPGQNKPEKDKPEKDKPEKVNPNKGKK